MSSDLHQEMTHLWLESKGQTKMESGHTILSHKGDLLFHLFLTLQYIPLSEILFLHYLKFRLTFI